MWGWGRRLSGQCWRRRRKILSRFDNRQKYTSSRWIRLYIWVRIWYVFMLHWYVVIWNDWYANGCRNRHVVRLLNIRNSRCGKTWFRIFADDTCMSFEDVDLWSSGNKPSCCFFWWNDAWHLRWDWLWISAGLLWISTWWLWISTWLLWIWRWIT